MSHSDELMPSLTHTEENYLKAALQISIKDETEWVSTGRLSTHLDVSPGTVTSMLQSLAKPKPMDGETRPPLVDYKPRGGVRLTEEGRRLALRMLRRHRLIEQFLVKTLGLTWDRVHEEAEHMEHAVSDFLIDRIDKFLGHPAADPHGDPIPTADGKMRIDRTTAVPLTSCPPGSRILLVHVVNQGADFLRYLSETGLKLGVEGIVQESNPAAGVVKTLIDGREISMSHTVAESLLVEVTDEVA